MFRFRLPNPFRWFLPPTDAASLDFAKQYADFLETTNEELVRRLVPGSNAKGLEKSQEESRKEELKKAPLTWTKLQALDLNILRLRADEELPVESVRLHKQLRDILGVSDYEAFKNSLPKLNEGDLAGLRKELGVVIEEIHYRYATTAARESNRAELSQRILRFACNWIFALLVVFFFAGVITWEVGRPELLETILTLFGATTLGALGAYVSIQNRIQSVPYEGDAVFRMTTANKGLWSLYLAPISGSIFALLAYLLFAAQLVNGDLFPEFKPRHGDSPGQRVWLTLNDSWDFPKLFLWSFVVGFAERLIPDSLNRIILKQNERIVGILTPRPAPRDSNPNGADTRPGGG
jgi:hypothetical protein